ncbi:exostosin-like protein [Artemisia annua]|uniref:Exostosin-like protein n=1 Tax=Artemisia annua TaxID=35608 RepID=A0A2U1Q7A4_ARTAN|nr:exostosin-like protein [Artemisia annua]
MDKDTSVNANSNVGLHSKGSQIAVDKDSNAQGTKNKPGSINQESSLLANAPILRSILKKAVRNVPGKDKNTSMSSVSTKVSGFKDKNACDIPTCDANELHSVGQQGDVDEVPLVGGVAAKVKNLDGTIFGSDGKDEVAGNGMSSGVGKGGRSTPTQVAQAASNSQGLNSNSSQPLVDNVGSGNVNGEDDYLSMHIGEKEQVLYLCKRVRSCKPTDGRSSVHGRKYIRLQRNGVQVRKHFVVNLPPKREATFYLRMLLCYNRMPNGRHKLPCTPRGLPIVINGQEPEDTSCLVPQEGCLLLSTAKSRKAQVALHPKRVTYCYPRPRAGRHKLPCTPGGLPIVIYGQTKIEQYKLQDKMHAKVITLKIKRFTPNGKI